MVRLKHLFLYALSLLFFVTLNIHAQISFEVSSEKLPNQPDEVNIAIGAFDVNGDGLDDIVLSDYDKHFYIYLNNEQEGFTLLTKDVIFFNSPWAVCGGDIDNDGVNEVIVGGILYLTVLDVNDSMRTEQLTVDGNFFAQGLTLFDINQDGWLDIFACNDNGVNHIYENDKKGGFFLQQNLIPVNTDAGNYAAVWSDVDGDLDADLYISKCWTDASFGDSIIINLLYINENGTFVESANEAGIADPAQSWAADFADIDNDGDMDLFVLNHETPSNLFLNDGQGKFLNLTEYANIQIPNAGYIQSLFKDFDNDGWIDLLIAGGSDFTTGELNTYLYRNNGDWTFTLVAYPLGENELFNLFSLAIGDWNGDGLPDIYCNTNDTDESVGRLLVNTTSPNFNFVQVNLVGTSSNRNGIGATLKLYGLWGVQVREVRAGESYGISNSLTKTFGLANLDKVDSLIIHWPSGIRQKVTDLTINQVNQIVESGEVTGISQPSPEDIGIELYPNITTGVVYITQLEQQNTYQQIQLIDMEGKLVYQAVLQDNKRQTIDISNLPKGMYLYKIMTNNKKAKVGKLIKME